jgi:hypothetical protein
VVTTDATGEVESREGISHPAHIRPWILPTQCSRRTLTEDVLVETIRHMNSVIFENNQLLRNLRTARDIAEERLRNAGLLVNFLRNEAAEREIQSHKRPREELDP